MNIQIFECVLSLNKFEYVPSHICLIHFLYNCRVGVSKGPKLNHNPLKISWANNQKILK